MTKRLFAVSLLAGTLSAPAFAAPSVDAVVKANPQAHDFIDAGCWACHGTEGQGGEGPALRPNLRPKEVFETIVRQGTPNGMLPYSHRVLPDAQLDNIYKYLQSLPAPAKPALLNAN